MVLPFKWSSESVSRPREIVGVLTILDREEGASEAFGSAGIPFIPLLTRTMITT